MLFLAVMYLDHRRGLPRNRLRACQEESVQFDNCEEKFILGRQAGRGHHTWIVFLQHTCCLISHSHVIKPMNMAA